MDWDVPLKYVLLEREFAQKMAKAKLSGHAHDVYNYLAMNCSRETAITHPVKHAKIARELDVRRATVVDAVKQLISKGMIERCEIDKHIRYELKGVKHVGKPDQ